jgi:hypothetical protein
MANEENILYKRGTPSKSVVETAINPYTIQTETPKRGVLVIDPNKVFDDYGNISDRYIKQEDLA